MTGVLLAHTELPPHTAELRRAVREFLDGYDFTPRVDSWLSGFDPGFSRELGARGWLLMTWPRAFGGHERSALERFVVNEELLAAGAPVAAHWIADRQSGPSLLRFGSEEQQARFLPAIASGQCFFAIGMSEPGAGSDLSSVTTRARAVEGGWRITGQKVWTSWAHRAHAILALVRTAPRGADRHAGLSQVIVELPSAGVQIRPIHGATGEHHFNEVSFDDAFVPQSRVVGEVGQGWTQVTSELAYERSGAERYLSVFCLVRAFAVTAGAADRRVLADAVARMRILRQAGLSIAGALDRGERPDVAAALVKDAGTAFEQDIVESIRAAAGVEADPDSADNLARMLAQAAVAMPGFTLRGGSTDVLRSMVARDLGLR